ncbi:MAG: hypothetical protein A3E88_05385 [Legionellales bacterium RIFCSPHIGHO2_12_FULL_35_11]|nr:MAG: hypothetical protein A3E88_05385 [Legionellales bacterium RIFCSPHIGHO2_12_FULL_35_11]
MLSFNDFKLYTEKPHFYKLISVVLLVLISLQFINFARNLNVAMQTADANDIKKVFPSNYNKSISLYTLNLPIFGKYTPSKLSDLNIKDSSLNITIVGIMFSESNTDSEVILRFPDLMEKNYKVNDTLPGGAKIRHISVDGVIINRAGNLERINLPKLKLNFQPRKSS